MFYNEEILNKNNGHTASMGIEIHANKLAENTEWNKPSERKRINRIITLNWM
jgi:hypothetical protein